MTRKLCDRVLSRKENFRVVLEQLTVNTFGNNFYGTGLWCDEVFQTPLSLPSQVCPLEIMLFLLCNNKIFILSILRMHLCLWWLQWYHLTATITSAKSIENRKTNEQTYKLHLKLLSNYIMLLCSNDVNTECPKKVSWY